MLNIKYEIWVFATLQLQKRQEKNKVFSFVYTCFVVCVAYWNENTPSRSSYRGPTRLQVGLVEDDLRETRFPGKRP